MKPYALVLGLLFVPAAVRAGDLEFTVERRLSDSDSGDNQKKGHADATNKSEKWHYEVKISNNAFKPTTPYEARYMVFVERQELGKKKGLERVDKVAGKAAVPVLIPHADSSFSTSDVTLRDQALIGNWIYSDGGRIKAKDTLKGVWVKVFDGTKVVGEFINPPTLTNHQKWDEKIK